VHLSLPRTLAVVAIASALVVLLAPPALAESKLWPTRVMPYAPHASFSPDTDLRSRSGYAAWAIDAFLQANTPLPAIGAAFTAAERRYGVNARYLLAQALHETDWGTSWLASVKHNLFGYNAYDVDPTGLAASFPTFESGVDAAVHFIRSFYLDPGGPWWGGFPTLRAMNLLYATDPWWADSISIVANRIDPMVPTLAGLGISFGSPQPDGDVVAGQPSRIVVPVLSAAGAPLPAELRFVARWSPVAIAESAPLAPPLPAVEWLPTVRSDGPAGIALAVAAPVEPGLYRLDVAARDVDGELLPPTDDPAIASVVVRVFAPADAVVSVASTGAALLVSLRPTGATTIPAAWTDVTGTPRATTVRVIALPLDPATPAEVLVDVPLPSDLSAGSQLLVPLPAPQVPSVLIARLVCDPFRFGRSAPAVVLVQGSSGAISTVDLPVHDPRTDALVRIRQSPGGKPAAGAISAGGSPGAATLSQLVVWTVATGELRDATLTIASAVTSATPADATTPAAATTPSGAPTTAEATTPAPAGQVTATQPLVATTVSELPGGTRLVVAGLVGSTGAGIDLSTLWVGWIAVPSP